MTPNFSPTRLSETPTQLDIDPDALARALGRAYAELVSAPDRDDGESSRRFEQELARLEAASRDQPH